MNNTFTMKSLSMATNFPILAAKLGETLWWSKKMNANKHTLKKQLATYKGRNEVLWLHGKPSRLEYLYNTQLTTSLPLNCCSQDLLLRIPSLGLNSRKKQVSHITSLHYYIYAKIKIISRTFLTTKEKSKIVASNSLSALISTCKNKNIIRRILENKWQTKK